MSSLKSGAMDFLTYDLYPQIITTGVAENETSTMANPEKDDQQVLGDSEKASETVSSEPRKMNIFLAIGLVVVMAFVLGMGD